MLILGVSFIGILTKLLIAVDVVICIMLIFVVLLQRPKSEGLGAAFGGDTASNIFGAQTTNVLTNLTRWLAGIFMVLTVALAVLYSKNDDTKTATQVYLDNAKKKSDEDKARKQAEDAAKAVTDPKNAKPVTSSEPVNPDDVKATIEKALKDAASKESPVVPPITPAAPPTATPVPPVIPPAPAVDPAPAPKPTESPAPAEAPKAPEPAKPAEPTPPPASPEPAKPAGN